MKIVPKLTIALLCGSGLVLAVNGYFRVRREVAFFEASRARDHEMIGRALSAAVSATWKAHGQELAMEAIQAVDNRFQRVHIQWKTEPPPSDCVPTISPPAPGLASCIVRRDPESTWHTYVPVEVAGERKGELELTESASPATMFAHNVLWDTVRATLALAVVSTFVAFLLGQWLVGRPVRALAQKAVRIGQGDFSGPLEQRANDELGELATEMNAMCERLASTLQQLRHADRLTTVGQLAAGIAHELGTPLNVVSGRATMIESGEADAEESREYARIIGDATRRMTNIIRQLLQFARRGGPNKSLVDVKGLVSDVLELLRPLARRRAIDLEVTASEADVSALVDAGAIQQVVTNLVMNAVQAMPRGGTVSVTLTDFVGVPPRGPDRPDLPEGSYLCLEVADEGEGISVEHMPRIFEPFFTTKDVGEGTGLGLPVSYGIVRDHGGWIDVESRPNEGSVFRVYLPRSTP